MGSDFQPVTTTYDFDAPLNGKMKNDFNERNYSNFRRSSERFFGKSIIRLQKPSIWR